jgi:hypothetical protein
LHVVLCGCDRWSLTHRQEYRLKEFKNKVPRKECVPKMNEVIKDCRRSHSDEYDPHSSQNLIQVIRSRRMKLAGNV